MTKLAIAIPTPHSRAEMRALGLRLARNAKAGVTEGVVLIEFTHTHVEFTYHVGKNRTLTDMQAGVRRVAERMWRELWSD